MKNAHLTTLHSDPSSISTEARISESDHPGSVRTSSSGHVPGDIVAGKYEIVSLLGEGGMGTVWRARSLVLDSDVAIKVLHCDHADRHAAERLLREARATARVGHPSIVRAFDFGETEAGEPFLAGTARRTVARVSAATAAGAGLIDGELVRVSTHAGSITAPLAVTAMPDYVVWLPTNAADCPVRASLAAGAGSVVQIAPASGPSQHDEVTA